jgi:glutathione S-transferase
MIVERTLHHFPLDPFSRQARLALGEKRLPFRDVIERYWERPDSLAQLNPSGLTPVLVETRGVNQVVACESRTILEHLEDQYPEPPLLASDPAERAEARRLVLWFDRKFDYEVNGLLLHEKLEKRLVGLGAPDPAALRAGREALKAHLAYINGLLGDRDWLAGDRISFADIAAAAHLSVIDYMGEVTWTAAPQAKLWYAKIKSRPCFRPLLGDRLPGLPPSPHYHDLDF